VRTISRIALLFLAPAAWCQPNDAPISSLANEILSTSNPEARSIFLASHKDAITPPLVKAMNDLAGQTYDRRQYPKALEMYKTTCEVATGIADRAGQATCLYGSGLAEARLSHSEEALALHRRAVELYQAVSNPNGSASAWNAIGVILHRRGELQESLKAYTHALEDAERSGNDIAMAQTNTNLGNVYKDLGNLRAAIQSLQRALEVTRKHQMDQQSAWILNNLGNAYHSQNDSELALSYHLESFGIKEKQKGADPADLASSVMNIGLDYETLGNYPKASASYDRALELADKAKSAVLHAHLLYNYGELLRIEGKLGPAKEKLTAALEECEKIKDPSTAAQSRVSLGEIAVDQGRYAEALDLGRLSLEYARKAGEIPAIEHAGEMVGAALHSLGRDQEAQAAFEEVIRITEELRELVPGDQRSAANFMSNHTSVYLRMAELEIGRDHLEEALAWVERSKARALFDVLSTGRSDITKTMSDDERREEEQRRRDVKRLNEQLLQESRRETPDKRRLSDLATRLEKARIQQRSFEIALYAAHPKLQVQRVAFAPASAHEMAAALPDPSTALLEYSAIGDNAVFLFVVTRESFKLFKLPVTQKELERDVRRFRAQIATRDLDYRGLALSLHRSLIQPAARVLQGKTTLVIVPDGVLWQLPFQALESAPDRYLLQDRAVFYTPSFSVLREMQKLHDQRKIARPRVLAVEAARVASAEREVDGLRQVYGSEKITMLPAADADEERIKREAPNYNVVHLAAHGVFENRNPMSSYLILAKAGKPESGILDARSMMDLDLKADTVVLSGCETGRGTGDSGEGLIGMTWALFIAGSPTTVASQWKVESDSTSDLMIHFHRNLRLSSKAKALQQAALDVMKKPEYRHPFYWSGFVVMGEGW
jgi:CHAT domain-containing protein/tetratricopeptide (TPR) repeat protein